MLSEIIATDRWMRISHSKVQKCPEYSPVVEDILSKYLAEYASFYNLSTKDVIDIYNNFTRQYSEHIRIFLATGKYPYQNGVIPDLGRVNYDIVLILSVVMSAHRHKIFKRLHNSSKLLKGNALLIGIGSGVELEFLNSSNNDIYAYDISISDFIKEKYQRINLNECLFEGALQEYDNIFAIELLEHLSQPLDFAKMAYGSLTKGGKFFFTTATNIPQIDHLCNFTDKQQWETNLESLGFEILIGEQINHESIDSKLDASNTWYITQK